MERFVFQVHTTQILTIPSCVPIALALVPFSDISFSILFFFAHQTTYLIPSFEKVIIVANNSDAQLHFSQLIKKWYEKKVDPSSKKISGAS